MRTGYTYSSFLRRRPSPDWYLSCRKGSVGTTTIVGPSSILDRYGVHQVERPLRILIFSTLVFIWSDFKLFVRPFFTGWFWPLRLMYNMTKTHLFSILRLMSRIRWFKYKLEKRWVQYGKHRVRQLKEHSEYATSLKTPYRPYDKNKFSVKVCTNALQRLSRGYLNKCKL